MAKTIKFNLICDEKPVRTLADLRENFSVEDVLAYFENGLLCKWLSVRGYEQELEQVKQIEENDDLKVVKALIKIFDIETDEQIIEQGVYALFYQKERESQLAQYKMQKHNADQIIRNYYAGYEEQIKKIIHNKADMNVIKAAVKEIDENYQELFAIDYMMLFELFYEFAPMAIYVMLTRDRMRAKYYLGCEREPGQEPVLRGSEAALQERMHDMNYIEAEEATNENLEWEIARKKEIEKKLEGLIAVAKMQEVLGEKLEVHETPETWTQEMIEANWQDVRVANTEIEEKEYLILRADTNTLIKNSESRGGNGYTYDQVNEAFKILKGIRFKCTKPDQKLYFMEV